MNTETEMHARTRDALNMLPAGNDWTVQENGGGDPATAHYSDVHGGPNGPQVTYETFDANGNLIDTGVVHRPDPSAPNRLVWHSTLDATLSGELVLGFFTRQFTWTVDNSPRTGTMTSQKFP